MSTNKLHCIKFDNKAKPNTWLFYVCPSTLIHQCKFFTRRLVEYQQKLFQKNKGVFES
jgi:hypothetical protein